MTRGINSDSGKFNGHSSWLWVIVVEGTDLESPETISGDLGPIQSLTIAGMEVCQTSEVEKKLNGMDRCGQNITCWGLVVKRADVLGTQGSHFIEVGHTKFFNSFFDKTVLRQKRRLTFIG